MARPEGLEPPTTWFEARYSIQLSYGRVYQCGFWTPLLHPTGKVVIVWRFSPEAA